MLFEGGPVQPESAICLARMRTGAGKASGFHQVAGAIGTVDLSGDPDVAAREASPASGSSPATRAGRPGQLEEEIDTGSWFVFDALPGDAFVPRPDDLWPMVLRRQGGIMAAVAHFPPDPTLN